MNVMPAGKRLCAEQRGFVALMNANIGKVGSESGLHLVLQRSRQRTAAAAR
jgi:hypothetical protein